jgi:drug/metabolite transporter (DMT)-like permease
MKQEPNAPVLDHCGPPNRRPPRFIVAMLLCAPGLLCWLAVLFRMPIPFVNGGNFIFLLLTAIGTAIASFIWYGIQWKQPKHI